jgi:hypothetical protein
MDHAVEAKRCAGPMARRERRAHSRRPRSNGACGMDRRQKRSSDHFVEEDRTTVGFCEMSAAISVGTGVGALEMTKQHRFDQLMRNRSTVAAPLNRGCGWRSVAREQSRLRSP